MAAMFKLLDLLSRTVHLTCWSVAWLAALGCAVWAFGALHFDFPIWKSAVAWAFAAAVLAGVVFLHGAWRKIGATF